MRYALINPNWTFEGSIYFGCREPHLPLELGYSKSLLQEDGNEVLLINAHARHLSGSEVRSELQHFWPDFTILTTANSYLFWRCAQPELRVPMLLLEEIRDVTQFLIIVGPHASTTPVATRRKLQADAVVMGECEEILPLFKDLELCRIPSICYRDTDPHFPGIRHSSNMARLPALQWTVEDVKRHSHHHHRFEEQPGGPGAEVEVSRGCPFHCTFCAKDNFRNQYRKRPLEIILSEIDSLLAMGVQYIYFIDEIFLPDKKLLQALVDRNFKFGVQTRIDLWPFEMIRLLGKAGCVSVEAGVESITSEGRDSLDKNCRLTTEQISEHLIFAKQYIPFVQANLLDCSDDSDSVETWRRHLAEKGIWANKPVPLFPYPGSPEYTNMWGEPDDLAWERAQNFYLQRFREFSDVQDQQPVSLQELETGRAWPQFNEY